MKVKVLLASLLLLPSLSSATPSSASHHHLLFTLFCLETIGGHHPHNWCLVEFWLAIQNVISSVRRDPDCLVDLSFKAALKTSNDGHGEGLLLAIVDKLAMFPQRWVFSLIPEAILVFQPSRETVPRTLTFILSTFSSRSESESPVLRTGVIWKSGVVGWGGWISSRSGCLLELLTELINQAEEMTIPSRCQRLLLVHRKARSSTWSSWFCLI